MSVIGILVAACLGFLIGASAVIALGSMISLRDRKAASMPSADSSRSSTGGELGELSRAVKSRQTVRRIIHTFGFVVALMLTLAWVMVWWFAYLPSPLSAGPWRVILDFATLSPWLEAIPEGVLLHALAVAFLLLTISEVRALKNMWGGS